MTDVRKIQCYFSHAKPNNLFHTHFIKTVFICKHKYSDTGLQFLLKIHSYVTVIKAFLTLMELDEGIQDTLVICPEIQNLKHILIKRQGE